MDKRYLVLDLDNTLIYARAVINVGRLKHNEFSINVQPSNGIYKIVIRDHVRFFIDSMLKLGYHLIVWSAGSEHYVKCITEKLFRRDQIAYVLTYNDLTDQRIKILDDIKRYIKDVNMDFVRLLDDNTVHRPGQEKHFIQISPFRGEPDNALIDAIGEIEKSYKENA